MNSTASYSFYVNSASTNSVPNEYKNESDLGFRDLVAFPQNINPIITQPVSINKNSSIVSESNRWKCLEIEDKQ